MIGGVPDASSGGAADAWPGKGPTAGPHAMLRQRERSHTAHSKVKAPSVCADWNPVYKTNEPKKPSAAKLRRGMKLDEDAQKGFHRN
jgi:hypothetical protein